MDGFLELEAVIAEGSDASRERAQFDQARQALRVDPARVVAGSCLDLLVSRSL